MAPPPPCSAPSTWSSWPTTPSGKQPAADKDGIEVGWIAGDDILDTGFDLAKNVVNDALHFALRVDTRKLPADLLRAYARAELQALAAEQPQRPAQHEAEEGGPGSRPRAAGGRGPGRPLHPPQGVPAALGPAVEWPARRHPVPERPRPLAGPVQGDLRLRP